MTDFARLVLASDTTGLRDARGELNRLTQAGAQTEGRVSRSMQGISNSYRMVAAAAAGFVAAAAGVTAALRGSQEIQQITNSLRAMGMSTAEAEAALNGIAEIADRTRAPLSATAQLFQRVSIAGRDLGASQSDVMRFTENVGLALGATGISAQEASGALLQLSQAMAGGVVRAEEFNSILEGAFPIAQAAADGIDGAAGSVGRLRQMVVAGEVSSREFFEAILSQSDALQDSFDQTEQTIGQATQGLRDSFALLARETDSALGISSGIATGLEFLGDNLELVRAGVLGAAAVITGMYLPAIVSATGATAAWIASLVTLRGALMAIGIGALVVAAGTLIDFLLRLRSATGSWGEALSALGDLAAGVWEGIKISAQSIEPAIGAVWQDVRAAFFTVLESMSLRWGNFLWSLGAAVDQIPGLGAFAEDFRDASDRAIDGMIGLNAEASKAAGAAIRLRNEASSLATQGFDKAREAAERLSEILSNEADATDEARREAEKLKRAIDEMGTSAGGKAADNLAKASDGLRDFEDGSKRAADRFGDLAASVITGSRSMSDVLSQLGNQLLSSGLSGLFGNIFGGTGLGNLFAGFFDQGGVIPAGQFAIAGERGPEIVTGPARVTSRADTARLMGGGARVSVPIQVNIEKGAERDEVRRRRGPSGQEIIDVAVSDSISGGRQDTVFGARFGAQPQTVRR